MGAIAASTQQQKSLKSQFHEALGELTEQLRGFELPPEASAIISTIEEMNTQERQQKRSHFSMVPSAFWAICKEQEVSLAAQAVWLYANEHCDRKTLKYRRSQRRLSEALNVSRETLDKYLEELSKAGLLEYSATHQGTTITLTDLWSENAERAIRKAIMKKRSSNLGASQDTPPSPPPSLGSLPSPSHESSDSSSSFFSSEGGQESGQDGQESLPSGGKEIRPQNKTNRQDVSPSENDQIRSDPPLSKKLEERGARYLAIAHARLAPLDKYYTNERKLAEALEQEKQAAYVLAHDRLLAQEDDSVLVWLLTYIQSENCNWYMRFRRSYPDVPIQLKHLLMKGFLKECMTQYEKVRSQLEYERYLENLSRNNIEIWEQQHRHEAPISGGKDASSGQQSQSSTIDADSNMDTDVTQEEKKETGGDINGHYEKPYQEIQGIGPRLAVYFLREIRQHNPEWEPQLHWAAPGSQVIDVVAGDQCWYFIEWQDYNNLRSKHGLPELPLPISMTPGLSATHQGVREQRHVALLEHNRNYIAKCRIFKAQQGG